MNQVVNQYERAYRTWPILTQCAANRNNITYNQLGNRLGIHHRPTRYILDIIQSYCREQNHAPLTILAINKTTRVPGAGFTAWDKNNLEQGRQEVFDYPWASFENPFSFASDDTSYDNLVDNLYNNPEQSEEVYARVKVRGMAQQIFRNVLLRAYSNRCAFTGIQFSLDASHIIPWSESTPFQRLNKCNGILLSSIHHRLFDMKLITIDEEYKIRYCDPPMPGTLPYSEYDRLMTVDLHGKTINLPQRRENWPNVEWIRQRNATISWLS